MHIFLHFKTPVLNNKTQESRANYIPEVAEQQEKIFSTEGAAAGTTAGGGI